MAQVASLLVRLQADITGYESAMRKAVSIAESIKKNFNSLSNTFSSVSQKINNLGKEIESVSKKAEKISKSMEKTGKEMTKYVTTPIMGAVGVGLNFNSTMEDAMTNFTTLLGSADKAQSMVSNLQSMASKTPFGMADLQSGAQTLLSFGQSAESIMPTLKMLGDVSLGNKQKFESLTLAFAQVQSAGKLTGQDLMQMINAGFNPLQIISEKTGKSIGELREIMEKGGISADMVTAAFKAATSEGGRFYNGMESASKTFTGRLSTLKDTFMELAGVFSQPIFDVLKEKMVSLTDKLSNLINWFKNLDEGTKKQIATFFLIAAAIGPVLLVLSKLLGAFSIFPKILNIVKIGFSGLSKVFSLLAANPIVAAILTIIGVLIYLYNTNENVRNAIQKAWESFKTFLSNLIQFIKTVFSFLAPIFKNVFNFIIKIFKGSIEVFIGHLRNAWDSIVVVVTAIMDIFAELFGFLGALLTGDWKAMWEHAKNIIKTAVGAIIVIALNLVDNMLLGFQKLSEILLDKVFAGITKGFQSMINGLLKGWNWLAGKFGWKQVAYLQIDTDKYKVSSAIQNVRNQLSKVADYWRGGEKAELPFSFTTTKGKKPDVPTIPQPEMPDLSAFDNLDMTFLNIGETAEKAKDGIDKLRDSVKSLVDSIRQQTDAFKNSLSLFDKFERKTISPQRLLNRLKAQVKAMTDWTNALTALQKRGVSETFLNELRMMGPSQVDYIRALAQMTDEQLAQYQQLYGQKYSIAQREAERAVMTEQKINTWIDKKIDIHITGNNISSQNDAAKLANEIIRELKLRGI